MDQYAYKVTSVPHGCTNYVIDEEVMKFVPTPPPDSIMIESDGPCNGTILVLVDDE